jgi:hypothetical protein
MNSHSGVGTQKVVLTCTRAAMLQCTSVPMEIETDKIIAKRMEEAVASITTDFLNLNRLPATARMWQIESHVFARPARLFPTQPYRSWLFHLCFFDAFRWCEFDFLFA